MNKHNNKKQFTKQEVDAIFAAIKQKWDELKATAWPDYRGHASPSEYPKYLHVSALAGMRPKLNALGEKVLDVLGQVVLEPWIQRPGTTYKKAALTAVNDDGTSAI